MGDGSVPPVRPTELSLRVPHAEPGTRTRSLCSICLQRLMLQVVLVSSGGSAKVSFRSAGGPCNLIEFGVRDDGVECLVLWVTII